MEEENITGICIDIPTLILQEKTKRLEEALLKEAAYFEAQATQCYVNEYEKEQELAKIHSR